MKIVTIPQRRCNFSVSCDRAFNSQSSLQSTLIPYDQMLHMLYSDFRNVFCFHRVSHAEIKVASIFLVFIENCTILYKFQPLFWYIWLPIAFPFIIERKHFWFFRSKFTIELRMNQMNIIDEVTQELPWLD